MGYKEKTAPVKISRRLVLPGKVSGAVIADEDEQVLRHRQGSVSTISLFTSMYFRSTTRSRFPLQFDLIVINSGTD
jgi:hypothetical protein